eukprot:4503664-Alexandrium_andersonii.AAC.1
MNSCLLGGAAPWTVCPLRLAEVHKGGSSQEPSRHDSDLEDPGLSAQPPQTRANDSALRITHHTRHTIELPGSGSNRDPRRGRNSAGEQGDALRWS